MADRLDEIDEMVDWIDDRIFLGEHAALDERMRTLDVSAVPPAAALALLFLSWPVRDACAHRSAYRARLEAHFVEKFGRVRATRLMADLGRAR